MPIGPRALVLVIMAPAMTGRDVSASSAGSGAPCAGVGDLPGSVTPIADVAGFADRRLRPLITLPNPRRRSDGVPDAGRAAWRSR